MSAKERQQYAERGAVNCAAAFIARQQKEAAPLNSVARNFWRFHETEFENMARINANWLMSQYPIEKES